MMCKKISNDNQLKKYIECSNFKNFSTFIINDYKKYIIELRDYDIDVLSIMKKIKPFAYNL